MVHDHLFFPKRITGNGLPWLPLSKPLFFYLFAGLMIDLTCCNSLLFGKWELNTGEVEDRLLVPNDSEPVAK